jgi:hypothetical protein
LDRVFGGSNRHRVRRTTFVDHNIAGRQLWRRRVVHWSAAPLATTAGRPRPLDIGMRVCRRIARCWRLLGLGFIRNRRVSHTCRQWRPPAATPAAARLAGSVRLR